MIKSILAVAVLAFASVAHAGVSGTGKASWYGGKFHGRTTASGAVFNKYEMTTASNIHRMGTRLRVTNLANGKSVVVKVTDTGGFGKYGRVLDLSQGAFQKIANLGSGVIRVRYEVVK